MNLLKFTIYDNKLTNICKHLLILYMTWIALHMYYAGILWILIMQDYFAYLLCRICTLIMYNLLVLKLTPQLSYNYNYCYGLSCKHAGMRNTDGHYGEMPACWINKDCSPPTEGTSSTKEDHKRPSGRHCCPHRLLSTIWNTMTDQPELYQSK